jgi:hypothetical protein
MTRDSGCRADLPVLGARVRSTRQPGPAGVASSGGILHKERAPGLWHLIPGTNPGTKKEFTVGA